MGSGTSTLKVLPILVLHGEKNVSDNLKASFV